jgi:hypothetical protein
MAVWVFCSLLRISRCVRVLVASGLLALAALASGAGIDSAKAQSIISSLIPPGCTASINADTGRGTGSCTFPGVTGAASCSFTSGAANGGASVNATCNLPGGAGTVTASCSGAGGTVSCTAQQPLLGTLTTTINTAAGTITESSRCGTVTTSLTGLNANVLAPLTACIGGVAQAVIGLRAALPSVTEAASQAGMTVVQGQITSIRDGIQRRQSSAPGAALAYADSADSVPPALAYASAAGPNRAPLYAKAPAAGGPTTNEYGLAVWGQGFGDYEQRTGTFNGMDIGRITRTWGFIGGIDKTFTSLMSKNDALVIGVLSGDTNAGVDTALGSTAQISGPSVGAYGIYVNGGFSTDLTFKADFYGVDQSQVTGGTVSFGVNNYTEAFNVNNKYTLNPAWWIEPTVGFMHTNTVWNDMAHSLGMIDGETWRVQGGARLGWSGVWNATRVDGTVTALAYDDVSITGGTLSTIATPLVPTYEGKLFGQLIGKLNFDYGNGLSSYFESEVRGTDGVVGVAGRVGLRYRF